MPPALATADMFASARVPDTNARLIVSIDERAMLGRSTATFARPIFNSRSSDCWS